MKRLFAILAFTAALPFQFAYAPSAQAMDTAELQISKAGDTEMNCSEISREVSSMESLISQARETQDETKVTSTGVGVAKVVGSYLVGTLAGGLGVLAAGYLVNEATDDKAEDALALEDTAQQRRSFMVGIYNAKGCLGPLEIASIEPAAGESKELPRPSRGYND